MNHIKSYTGSSPYIFISYCHHNEDEVNNILHELSANRFRFWYDEGIQSGSAWADEISFRIKNCTQFLVFLSTKAVESENVKDEIHLAIKHKKAVHVIYLEDIDLEGGLELRLDRIQAVSRSDFATLYGFYNKLIKSLDTETREEVLINKAFADLSEQYEITSEKQNSHFIKFYVGYKKSTKASVFIKHYVVTSSNHGTTVSNMVHNEIQTLKLMNEQCCPNVPRLLDVFSDAENMFVVENLLTNCSTLDELIKNHNFQSVKERESMCVDIIIKVASALKYFHNSSTPIAHRDIKPKNIMVNNHGDIYILDFNCCLCYKDIKDTRWIDYLGTIGYAAPEAYYNDNDIIPDHRADIYNLGITLHELLTNHNPASKSVRHPLRYYHRDFHPFLEKIIEKMVNNDRELRYQNIGEVIYDLKNYQEIKSCKLCLSTIKSDKKIKRIKNSRKRFDFSEIKIDQPHNIPSVQTKLYDVETTVLDIAHNSTTDLI